MSRRGSASGGDAGHRRRMRVLGYADGLAGRPARYADASYQTSWRRGRERRSAVAGDK